MTKPLPAREAIANPRAGYISEVDYFVSLMAERNARFDSEISAVRTALETLRESATSSIEYLRASFVQRLEEVDRRVAQRMDMERSRLEVQVEASREALTVALRAVSDATTKADLATEKRFESVNEFRDQLKDQAGTFIPRIETEQRLTQLSTRLDELRSNDTQRSARSAGSTALFGWVIGGIGALATILVILNSIISNGR